MPVSSDPTPGIARADLAACRALLRDGSRTFFAASMLLPARISEPASALYAFCRLADDAVDLDQTSPAAAIARLRERLALIYDGRPSTAPADRAFAATVARFDIPRALPEALIEGFAWDVEGRQYETLCDLNAYGARVAGSVGAMMTLVMGRRQPEVLARACELGMAMQLSNIARDVGEDARAGRLYLPRQWMREVGIDPEAWLNNPVFSPVLGVVIQRLLEAADHLYARSGIGIDGLPAFCRPGIRAARYLYAEIGRQVERNGYDSVSVRAVVPAARKIGVLARSLVARDRAQETRHSAFHEQARFLIESVRYVPASDTGDGSIAWLVDLFGRLEQQDRLRRAQRPSAGYRAARSSTRHYRRSRPAGRLQKLEC